MRPVPTWNLKLGGHIRGVPPLALSGPFDDMLLACKRGRKYGYTTVKLVNHYPPFSGKPFDPKLNIKILETKVKTTTYKISEIRPWIIC